MAQAYVDKYIWPHWGCNARIVPATVMGPGAWALIFLDNADVANAAGYHDLTPSGMPLSKVFVSAGDASWTASHELVEMLVDPGINMMTLGPNARLTYAYEAADPVEETYFTMAGMKMSNFVLPAYFEDFRRAGSAKFDLMNLVSRPFQLLPGGYQQTFDGRSWGEVFGSLEKEKRFAKEDRRGHRSEIRKKRSLGFLSQLSKIIR